jgi:hypothetical protein
MAGWADWGTVSGTVRTMAGEPVGDCQVVPDPTTNPAQGLPDSAWYTAPDGRFQFGIPLGTYTMRARYRPATGTPLYGEVTEVTITADRPAVVDIVVAEQQPE